MPESNDQGKENLKKNLQAEQDERAAPKSEGTETDRIAELQRQLARMQLIIKAKDAIIGEKDAIIGEKDAELAAEIEAKDAEIGRLGSLREKNAFDIVVGPGPNHEDLSSRDSSTSRAKSRVHVQNAEEWPGFLKDQSTFIEESEELIRAIGPIPVMGNPIDSTLRSEEGFMCSMVMTIFFVLNNLFKGQEKTTITKECDQKVDSRPDGITMATFEDRDDSHSQAIVSWEGKRDCVCPPGHDLRQDFKNSKDKMPHSRLDAVDVIQQAVGQCLESNTEFFIITSPSQSWAGRVLSNGKVLVSPPYQNTTTGPASLMGMLYYVISIALKSLVDGRSVWAKPFMLKVDAEDAGGESKSSGAHKPAGRGAGKENKPNASGGSGGAGRGTTGGPGAASFSCGAPVSVDDCQGLGAGAGRALAALAVLHRVLEDQPGRITCKALLPGGGFAVVKAFAARADRDRERQAYAALQELQEEGCVPRMLAADCPPLVRGDARRHAMMVSWVGPPLEDGHFWELPLAAHLRAREIVARMHGLGVVHGDPYARNIVHNRETGEVAVVDFGAALTRALLGAAAFEEECALEMQGMDARAADAAARLQARRARALEAGPGGRGGPAGGAAAGKSRREGPAGPLPAGRRTATGATSLPR